MGLELGSVSSQWFFKSPWRLLHICILLVWLFDMLLSPGSTRALLDLKLLVNSKTACPIPRLMMSSVSIKSLQRKSENSNLQLQRSGKPSALRLRMNNDLNKRVKCFFLYSTVKILLFIMRKIMFYITKNSHKKLTSPQIM